MPAAYERCLKHVEGKVKNKHAVCTAANAGNIKQHRKREASLRHGLKKARKKHDL